MLSALTFLLSMIIKGFYSADDFHQLENREPFRLWGAYFTTSRPSNSLFPFPTRTSASTTWGTYVSFRVMFRCLAYLFPFFLSIGWVQILDRRYDHIVRLSRGPPDFQTPSPRRQLDVQFELGNLCIVDSPRVNRCHDCDVDLLWALACRRECTRHGCVAPCDRYTSIDHYPPTSTLAVGATYGTTTISQSTVCPQSMTYGFPNYPLLIFSD
jgi:hypothetical protein